MATIGKEKRFMDTESSLKTLESLGPGFSKIRNFNYYLYILFINYSK